MNEILGNIDMGYEGFASANEETLDYLSKALSAGSGVDAASFTGGRALIPESLDSTLVNILHSQEDAVLFQKLKKQPIKSPVHQWDVRNEVGANDGAWVAEGGDSIEADQTIARAYQTAKYLQTLRKVTLQASISNMIEDAMALEKNAGTLWLIRNVEKALFYGNSSYVTEQPDGLIAQIPSTNVLDLRGKDATSADFVNKIEEGARNIRQSFGKPSDIFCSTMIMSDVQRMLRDRIRFEPGTAPAGSTIFNSYPTPFGTPKLNPDIFIEEGGIPAASSLTTQRPAVLTVNSTAHGAHASSEFASTDAGDYVYKLVGVNKYGDGVATAEQIVTGVLAGERVTINITVGSPAPTAIKLYRSIKGGATGAVVRYCKTVAVTAATMDVFDTNSDLPGCSDVFMLTMDSVYDAIEWAQFLPMMKFDLYPTNAAVYPFLMLLFGALAVKKGVQHIRIKNVAPSTLGWF